MQFRINHFTVFGLLDICIFDQNRSLRGTKIYVTLFLCGSKRLPETKILNLKIQNQQIRGEIMHTLLAASNLQFIIFWEFKALVVCHPLKNIIWRGCYELQHTQTISYAQNFSSLLLLYIYIYLEIPHLIINSWASHVPRLNLHKLFML